MPGYTDRRTVTYNYDIAGRLSSLSSGATSYGSRVSVSNISYAPHSSLERETYGNNLVHAISYNNRLQPLEIKLGTTAAPTSVLSLVHSYGTTDNNGNLKTVTYNGGGASYTQTFSYDALNRLSSAQETSAPYTNWTQNYLYDRYGNLGGMYGQNFYTFDANNRIIGKSYDAAGNLLNDRRNYTYDAENRLSKDQYGELFRYDGEGKRVRMVVEDYPWLVYDIEGRVVAEFGGKSGGLLREYVYGASGLLAMIDNLVGTQYLTSDHLGSPRVATNGSGELLRRNDYYPFGEWIPPSWGGRSVYLGWSNGISAGGRQKFTGKEVDGDTQLHFFEARYYQCSTMGRFMSPDEFTGGPEELFEFAYAASVNSTFYADLYNPQSLNKYQYCHKCSAQELIERVNLSHHTLL